jgi:hypothetical protein
VGALAAQPQNEKRKTQKIPSTFVNLIVAGSRIATEEFDCVADVTTIAA